MIMNPLPYSSRRPSACRNLGRALLAGILCWPALSLYSQTPNQVPPPVPLTTEPAPKLGPEELADLLAPIALYPDALIALILPASTAPADVVMGSRFLESNADISLVDAQPWDDSVKSLTRYPEVLSWMNTNLDWTASVGEAFVVQPADVMDAIQKLRARAQAKGNLTNTPQQKVVVYKEVIRIVPANPEIIYVPQYDPEVIYVQTYQPSYRPFLTFGVGFAVGSWLTYDFDWNRRCVYRGNWRGWNDNNWNDGNWNNDRGDGNNVSIINNNVVNNNINVVNISNDSATQWQPSADSRRQVSQRQRNNTGNARFTTTEARQERAVASAAIPANGNAVTANASPQPDNPPASARPNRLPRPSRIDTTSVSATAETQNRDNRPRNPAGSTVTDPSAPVAAATPQEPRRNRDGQSQGTINPPGGGNPPTRSPDVAGSIPSNRDGDRRNIPPAPSPTPRPNRGPDVAESTPPEGDLPNPSPASTPRPNVAAVEDRRVERPRNTPTAAPQIPRRTESAAPTPRENPPRQENPAREPRSTPPPPQSESNAPQPEGQRPPQAQQESNQRQQRQQAVEQQQRQQAQAQQESNQRQQRQQAVEQQQRQQAQAQQESNQRQQRQQAVEQQQRQQAQAQQESNQRQQRQQAVEQQQRQQEQRRPESNQ